MTARLISDTRGIVAWDSVIISFVASAFHLQSIDFLGHHNLVSDPVSGDGQPVEYFNSVEWFDANADGTIDPAPSDDHRFPVSYTGGASPVPSDFDSPTLNVVFVNAGLLLGDELTVRGLASDGTVVVEETAASGSGSTYAISNVELDHVIPNSVKHLPDFTIKWEVSMNGGGTWFDAGTSTNTIYVTYTDPQFTPLFETLVYIGSHYADGATDDAATVAGAWSPFDQLNVTNVSGQQLTYWATPDPNDTEADQTEELLRDQNGQCGSWAELFRDVLRAQGITNTVKKEIRVDPSVLPASAAGASTAMAIKHWGFSGNGVVNGYDDFRYLIGADAGPLARVPAAASNLQLQP